MRETIGWMVFRADPPKLVGPHLTFEIAVDVAEGLGNEFRIGYGKREDPDGLTFTPMDEPSD